MRAAIRQRALVATAVLAVIAGGCGGEEEPEPVAPTAGSGATGATGAVGSPREKFVVEAERICREASAEIDAAQQEEGVSSTAAGPAFLDFVERVAVPRLRERNADLAELEPPPGDEDEVEEIIAEMEGALDEVAATPEQILEADPFGEADELAIGYGLRACSG